MKHRFFSNSLLYRGLLATLFVMLSLATKAFAQDIDVDAFPHLLLVSVLTHTTPDTLARVS